MLKPEIEDGETRIVDPAFRADVLAGLSLEPKAIQARWLYDHRGSELFEDITDVPEYYPTRTETALLRETSPKVAEIAGKGRAVVEFGSGSSAKTPILLESSDPSAYVPIDISGDFLRASADALRDTFPALPIHPVEGDFLKPIALPESVRDMPKLGFFPGSTIGNMTAAAGVDLLRAMRQSLGEGSLLLIGMDRVKDESILIPAYDDAGGVTAEFNLNLLRRINRELDGDIPVDTFRHKAVWNDNLARVEMHLEALDDVGFTVCGQSFAMKAGETIHTENSHKYGPRDARLLLRSGNWTPVAEWTDPKDWFALILAEAKPVRPAP